MKAKRLHNGTIIISLSERNLLALLSKLKRKNSAKTLCKTTDAGFIMLIAEPDSEHYGTTEPGKMHPIDEIFIQENSK